MPEPVSFTSASPRHSLPLLFAGQSQKEFHVNEAHAIIDALLHPAVIEEANGPPASPAEGDCWLVSNSPTGTWESHPGKIACWSSGDWLFAAPRDGLRVLDIAIGQFRLYRSGAWTSASPPAVPSGGTVVDGEARAAISELIAALADAGILPA